MPDPTELAAHYSNENLLSKIEAGILAAGLRMPPPLEALGPVDEFHIGGRIATQSLLSRLNLTAGKHVVDLGCGLGGPARFAAQSSGAQVTGMDLSPDMIDAGRALTGMTVMLDRVSLVQGNILETGFADGAFDAGFMIHVGMNIADKAALMAEAARILKPGARFGIYDVMQTADGTPAFPVPWASEADQSCLAPAETYVTALEQAGFRVEMVESRAAFALQFFDAQARARAMQTEQPPLSLHIVLGPTADTKLRNMVKAVRSGFLAPVEIVAERLG